MKLVTAFALCLLLGACSSSGIATGVLTPVDCTPHHGLVDPHCTGSEGGGG